MTRASRKRQLRVSCKSTGQFNRPTVRQRPVYIIMMYLLQAALGYTWHIEIYTKKCTRETGIKCSNIRFYIHYILDITFKILVCIMYKSRRIEISELQYVFEGIDLFYFFRNKKSWRSEHTIRKQFKIIIITCVYKKNNQFPMCGVRENTNIIIYDVWNGKLINEECARYSTRKRIFRMSEN